MIFSKFPLGRLLITAHLHAYVEARMIDLAPYLARHADCDWGDVCIEDWKANFEALICDLRLFSVYHLPSDEKIWIITEADRSATTLLFPEDY